MKTQQGKKMENNRNKRALIVDDEILNLEILSEDLQDEGFEVVRANNGLEAWKIIQEDQNFDVILLDRMMPHMNGMEFVNKFKEFEIDKKFKIPVIMQTSAASKEQVVEGIKSGVYYYLTKPFDRMVMLSIVNEAINNYNEYNNLRKELAHYKSKLKLVKECHFEAATYDDIKYLSTFLANYFIDPEKVILGVTELLVNALEHGNLGITYEEKSELKRNDTWFEEIQKRQNMPEYANRKINVYFARNDEKTTLTIIDEGKGFNWKKYMEIDPDRATHAHGRGIALSKIFSFDELNYKGNGNTVECVAYTQN